MPTIAWAGDLHLDHSSDAARQRLADALRDAGTDVVVVSGDISVASRLTSDLAFLADAARRPLYFVLGNHDHFGGSVAAVRDAVLALAARRPGIQWLPPAGVVALDRDAALVGVDGWADGRHGNPLTTRLVLNDDRLIAELQAQPSRIGKLAVKRALADADAARLAVLLDRATATARRIVVVSHVPPFTGALPTTGRLAAPEWLPLLVCQATGDVLVRAATAHPDHRFLVLSGHTHVATDVMILPNLRSRVAGARYGEPRIVTVDV